MSSSTIAPTLPEGAGYGVVVGIGVSQYVFRKYF